MAIISNQQDQQNGNNLNAGMNTQQQVQPVQQQGATPVGAPASQPAHAPRQSNQFTNFGSYLQSNQQAGQRLSNLLGSNVSQASKKAETGLEGGSSNIQGAVDKENERIKSSIQNLTGAVDATSKGDYSKFNQFLNPQQGVTNAAQQTLATPYQQLAMGQSQQQQLQQQANQMFSNAGVAQAGIQNQQNLMQTGAGVQQLLGNLLGQHGRYGTGSRVLDQSLLMGNTGAYSNLLNTTGQNVANLNRLLGEKQASVSQGLTGLGTAVSSGQTEAQRLANLGLGNVDTTLAANVEAANKQRELQQAAVKKEFETGAFNAADAAKLGLQKGTTLFNVLKNDPSQYYSLNQLTANKANQINADQLAAYSSLQQMLGQNRNTFDYQDVGKGIGDAYSLDAQKFQKNLADQYQNALEKAQSDVISGHGHNKYYVGEKWEGGLFGGFRSQYRDVDAYANSAVKDLIDTGVLKQGSDYFNQLAQQQTPTTAAGTVGSKDKANAGIASESFNETSDVQGNVGRGLAGAVEGAGQGAAVGTYLIPGLGTAAGAALGAGLGSLDSAIKTVGNVLGWGSGARNSAMDYARELASQDAQRNWESYQQQMGYKNLADILSES